MISTSPDVMRLDTGPWTDLEIDVRWSTLPQALQQAAARWPELPAFHFVDGGERESWSELERRVLTVASGLDRLGVRPGDRVGILLGNVPEFPAAWLGILATGAVAVPMNPHYTARELDFIASDTGMSALILDASCVGLLDGLMPSSTISPYRVVVVGEENEKVGTTWTELLSAEPWTQAYLLGAATDLANIQYTSGTTGLPKGCMLTHEYWSVMGRVATALREVPSSNVLADHPFFYLQNQSYFANAVITGAQLHVTHGLSLSRYLPWLHDFDIDLAWVSDALLTLEPSELDATHSLRLAPTDGVDPDLHAELERRFNVVAREWYASTEVGIGTVSPWEDEGAVGSGSMGYAAPLRETKVIGDDLEKLPEGVPGELCVRGPGMMLGYWNRPEINSDLFLAGGWFRTGDIVRIDPDGQHYFVGRAKDMVRRSGENIAAAEVEQQLETHPGVDAAAVVPVPDAYRGEEIKAVVVRKDGADPSPQELGAWCRERLAAYKVPRFIAFADELPYTPSGKVRKAALKDVPDPRAGAYDLVEEKQL